VRVIFTALAGILILALALVGGYFSFSKDSGDNSATQHQPKNSTFEPSSQNGLGKEWVVYKGESEGIKFTFKYPADLKQKKLPIDNKIFHLVSNTDSIGHQFKDGDILLAIAVLEEIEPETDLESQITTFAGLKATKFTGVQDNANILAFYINGQAPVGKNQYFVFDCHTSPPDNISLKTVCEKISETFEFVD
jgi:hypothetical protein